MKKTSFIIAISLLIASCASTAKFEDVNALSPMAVVSISSNGDVSWYGEQKESSGLLGNILNKKVDASENEDLGAVMSRSKKLLDTAEETFIASMSNLENVKLAEKNEVFNSTAYKFAKNSDNLYSMADLIQPEGYKFISDKDKTFTEAINKDMGVMSNVFVNFTFNKAMAAGIGKNGKVGVRVSMYVKVVNEEGRQIFQKFYFASSKDSIGITAGVYDPIKLFDLFPGVISEVCNQFSAEFSI